MNKEVSADNINTEMDLEDVLKKIYTSCDPQNLNQVPTSVIVEYIKPYMLEDLSALKSLQKMLDPDEQNVCVDSELFHRVMNEWTQKIGTQSEEENSDDDLIHANSRGDFQPFNHSTPRASFGQKLLQSQNLLNLSNISQYDSSPTKQTKENSTVNQEKIALEEELKQTKYELNKVLSEMSMLKSQLISSEEQNEYLHEENKMLKDRMHSEDQVNGHLEENKICIEAIKDDLNLAKKRIDELTKKLGLYEKENNDLNMYVQKLEKENSELEDRCSFLSKCEQLLKNKMVDVETELDLKEHELLSIIKINDDLKSKLEETQIKVDSLSSKNEMLDCKKRGLEKLINERYSLSSHYNTFLSEVSNMMPLVSPSPKELKPKTLCQMFQSSTPKVSRRKELSLNLNVMSTRSMPNIFCAEHSASVDDQDINESADLDSHFFDLNCSNGGPCESLQMELFKVDPQFDYNKIKLETVKDYEEQIDSLNKEIDLIRKKSDEKSMEYRSEIERLEKCLLLTQNEKTDALNKIKILEDKMNCDKIDFKSIYLDLEKDYGCKIKLIEQLQNDLVGNRCVIENLETRIKSLEEELEESKKEIINNRSISETVNKVEEQVDNRNIVINELKKLNAEFRFKIDKLEKDLCDKIKQLGHLKEVLKTEEMIKNKMWEDNKEINSNLYILSEDYKKLLKQIKDYEATKTNYKRLKDEYDYLLIDYNKELTKKKQIKNYKNELSNLKTEIDSIKKQFIEFNIDFKKSVSECKDGLNKLIDYKGEEVIDYRSGIQRDKLTQGRSFEKQKLTIDRLKEKVEILNEELRNERSKIDKYEECKDANLKLEQIINNLDNKLSKCVCNKINNEETIDYLNKIHGCCAQLNTPFMKFVELWKKKIEKDVNFKNFTTSLKLCSSIEMNHVLSVVVDNFENLMQLLNIMCSIPISSQMDDKNTYLDYYKKKAEVNEPKAIRKFTLRPPKLHLNNVVQQMTPDSPSAEINQIKVDSENSSQQLPLLTFEFRIQDAYPHLSHTLLENLNLHETSPKVVLSNNDTEKLFTTLAIQIALDSTDIKERLEKQKTVCENLQKKFIYLIRDVSLRLKDHKCIGASDSIGPVFIMLEDIRFQMQELLQSAGLFGSLMCEHKMTKCWNLVTNYVANIRKETDYWKNKSAPIKMTPSSCTAPETKRPPPESCNKKEKSGKSVYRTCYSIFNQMFRWFSYLSLFVIIAVLFVHGQCRMSTRNIICPLDTIVENYFSETIGPPPY